METEYPKFGRVLLYIEKKAVDVCSLAFYHTLHVHLLLGRKLTYLPTYLPRNGFLDELFHLFHRPLTTSSGFSDLH